MDIRVILVSTLFGVPVLGQFSQPVLTDCSQLMPGYSGYICSPDLTTVRYCSPQFAPGPTVVDSEYCLKKSCYAFGGGDGFCGAGIDPVKSAGKGPTDCSQVANALNPTGYICSMDYTISYRCDKNGKTTPITYCDSNCCFASTNGKGGGCPCGGGSTPRPPKPMCAGLLGQISCLLRPLPIIGPLFSPGSPLASLPIVGPIFGGKGLEGGGGGQKAGALGLGLLGLR